MSILRYVASKLIKLGGGGGPGVNTPPTPGSAAAVYSYTSVVLIIKYAHMYVLTFVIYMYFKLAGYTCIKI